MIHAEQIILFFVSVTLAVFPGFNLRWIENKGSWQYCNALTEGLLVMLGILKHFWEAQVHKYFTDVFQASHFHRHERTTLLVLRHLIPRR